MKKTVIVLSLLLVLFSCKTANKNQETAENSKTLVENSKVVYNFSAIKGYDYSQILFVSNKDGSESKMRLDGREILIKRVDENNYISDDNVYKLEFKNGGLVVYKNNEKKEFQLTEHKSLDYAKVDQKQFLFNYQAIDASDVKMLVYTYGNKANIRVNGNTTILYKNGNIYESKDKSIKLSLGKEKATYQKNNEVIEFKDVKTKDMYYALEIREYIFNFINRKSNSKIMLKISPDSDVLVFRKDKKNYRAKKLSESEFRSEDGVILKLIKENNKFKLVYIDKNNTIKYDNLKTKDPFFAR